MDQDVVLDCGWGQLVFGQTFADQREMASRAPPGGPRSARHLPLPPRPPRLRGPSPPRVLHRPQLHVPPALHADRRGPAASRPGRGGPAHPGHRRRRGHGPHLRAVRDGPGAARGAVAQPRRDRPRRSTWSRSGPTPGRSWARSPVSTTSACSTTPRGAPASGASPSTPTARCRAWAGPSSAPWPRSSATAAGRTWTSRSCTTTRPPSPSTRSWASSGCPCTA